MSAGAPRQPVAILISGRGSNMRTLIERSGAPDCPYMISKVFSDRPEAPGLAVAAAMGVATQILDPRDHADRAAYDNALGAAIEQDPPALLVLAGFMRILSAPFVHRFDGRILNIHPSLLPKYPGLHTHRRVLEAHEREHGATVHFVTASLDGGPAIVQGRVAVLPDDDESRLAARVQRQEHRIYPLAVGWYCAGRLRQRENLAWLDGKPLEEPVQLTDGNPS